MRISDWSSDVCSSDLSAGNQRDRYHARLLQRAYPLSGKNDRENGDQDSTVGEELRDRQLAAVAQNHPGADREEQHRGQGAGQDGAAIPLGQQGGVEEDSLDRQRVVEGKKVSVREDPGGGRRNK